MASRFHAIFGTCRRKGGTKRKCYDEALKKVSKGRKKKRKVSRKKRATKRRR